MTIKIYHNPRRSKSRQTLELIRQSGIEPHIIEYLETPPGTEEIEYLLQTLHKEPHDILRHGEDIYKELDLGNTAKTRDQLITAMARHPALIQRPIVITKKGAAICRPPELVRTLL